MEISAKGQMEKKQQWLRSFLLLHHEKWAFSVDSFSMKEYDMAGEQNAFCPPGIIVIWIVRRIVMKKIRKTLLKSVVLAVMMSFFVFGNMGDAFAKELEGTWKHNSKGWWYVYENGTYPRGKWCEIKGKWYYFNAEGYMLTGWKKNGKQWYYLGLDGTMRTGWVQVKGAWYYLGSNGVMRTGWQEIKKTWYYFSESGVMMTGWQKIKGSWYYFGESGDMKTGWQTIRGKQYYFFQYGDMATGEVMIGERVYVFDRDGDTVFMIDEEGLFTMDEKLFGLTYEGLKQRICMADLKKPEYWSYWGNNLYVSFIGDEITLLFQDDRLVMTFYDFPEAGNVPPGLLDSAATLWGRRYDSAGYQDDNKYHYVWKNLGKYNFKYTYEQYKEVYLTGESHYRQRYISDMYD